MRGSWFDGCTIYGTPFENRRERREDDEFRFDRYPMYWRLRRHSVRYGHLW